MIIKVTENKFADIMTDHNFSYQGACALFQYLEGVQPGDTELDAVGLRCEFSEYESYLEYAEGVLGFCPTEHEEEWEDADGLEEFAKTHARKHGDVVAGFDGGIIVRDN